LAAVIFWGKGWDRNWNVAINTVSKRPTARCLVGWPICVYVCVYPVSCPGSGSDVTESPSMWQRHMQRPHKSKDLWARKGGGRGNHALTLTNCQEPMPGHCCQDAPIAATCRLPTANWLSWTRSKGSSPAGFSRKAG